MEFKKIRFRNMSKSNTNKRVTIEDIFEDYMPDILNDDDYWYKLKSIISSLPLSDRTILILYADCKNMREVSKKLNVSTATICNQLKRIKKNIQSQL